MSSSLHKIIMNWTQLGLGLGLISVTLLVTLGFSGTGVHLTNYYGAARVRVLEESLLPDTEVTSCTDEGRVSHLRAVCRRHPSWRNASFLEDPDAVNDIFVDETHKIVYCSIPKIASTTMLKLLTASLGARMGANAHWLHDKAGLHRLRYYNRQQREDILNTYYKFVVVRHPLSRLVSCYFSKFGEQINVMSARPVVEHNMDVLLRYFNGSSDTRTFKVSLSDFMTLLSQQDELGFHERHWTTYHRMCYPCDITYDHVVRLESFDEDMRPILARLQKKNYTGQLSVTRSNERRLSKRNSNDTDDNNNKESNSSTPARPSLEHDLKVVDSNTIQRIIQYYARDFLTFAYDWKLNQSRVDSCHFMMDMDQGH